MDYTNGKSTDKVHLEPSGDGSAEQNSNWSIIRENAELRREMRKNGMDPDAHLNASETPDLITGPNGFEWGPPVPLDIHEQPNPVPLYALPDWVEAHVESVSGFLQIPSDLSALLALCTIAGAVQKKVEVELKPGWTEPLTLWGVAVLDSGTRKSPAFSLMTAPVGDYESELRQQADERRQRALDTKEILEQRLQQAKKQAVKAKSQTDRDMAENEVRAARDELEDHEVPTIPQLWIDDITSEELLRLMSDNNGRLLAMSPEGDLFKYMSGRYDSKGAVLNIYKKSWTGDEAARDNRMSRDDSDVPNPALSVALCAQPTVLQDLAQKRTFRGEGLLARFLYVVPKSTVGFRKTGADVPALDRAAKTRYERKLTALLELTPDGTDQFDEWMPHTLQLTHEAQSVLWDFEASVEAMLRPEGRLDGITDWGSKLVGQMARIAGILHVAESDISDPIQAGTMLSAVKLTRAFIPHALNAYALLEANEKTQTAQYLYRRICEKLGVTPSDKSDNSDRRVESETSVTSVTFVNMGSLSKRDLWRAVQNKGDFTSADDLDPVLVQLEEHELIHMHQPESSGGRPPSPCIYVNPRAVQ
jgi:hypothetical protein